jgi:hypothetical protein
VTLALRAVRRDETVMSRLDDIAWTVLISMLVFAAILLVIVALTDL